VNHSPAPWRVERDGHNHWGKLEVIGSSLSVIGFRVATDVTAQEAMRKDADAELIAAAPETAAKMKAWQKMAADLYSWEPIIAVDSAGGEWEGARRMIPPGFTEVSNRAGVSPEEWQAFCEANN
jgi:hypothetical protein